MALLDIVDLRVHFKIQNGWVKAVDGVSFSINSGETMGLVGESGCGKTTAAYAITQLLPSNGYIKSGRILFKEPARVAKFRTEYDARFKGTPKARAKELSQLKRKLNDLHAKIEEAAKNNLKDESSKEEAGEVSDRIAALTYQYDLLEKSKRADGTLDDYNEAIRKIRWTEISMIFQGAMNAFNPVFKIGDQIIEAIQLHEDVSDEDARKRAMELFKFVGVAPDRLDNFPHEFSGGMKQRAMIALALALNPSFIIADEPTTALDVVTQDRILVEIRKLQEKLRMAMMIITHDVSVVAEVSDKIGVMYAGMMMEIGRTTQVFRNTAHPYTAGLLGSFPSIKGKKRRLISIPGFPPDLVNPPPGCPFHPRCQYAQPRCSQERPLGIEIEPGHIAYCHFSRELWDKLRRTE